MNKQKTHSLLLPKSIFLLSLVCISFLSCKKTGSAEINSSSSAADKIAGSYTGLGQYLPGNIDLGNTLNCGSPSTDYNTLYQSGTASINIIKVSDSTVNIILSSGPFPKDTFNKVLLKARGSMIQFSDSLAIHSRTAGLVDIVEINAGTFDPSSNTLSFSRQAPGVAYSFSTNCISGLPYYYSTFTFDGTTGLNVYFNTTIKRYVFNGTK